MTDKQLLSYRQAGEHLGVCERTIFNYVESGELPSIKLGRLRRIDPDDLARFIESRKEVKA